MLITPKYSDLLFKNTGINIGIGININGEGYLSSPCICYNGDGFLSNVALGAYSYLVPPFQVKSLSVGNYSSIANYFSVVEDHPTNLLTASPVAWRSWLPDHIFFDLASYTLPITYIGSDVWIGTGVTVKSGIKIGDGAFIGAGAVVTHDIPAFSVAVGVPARVIKYRFTSDFIERIKKTQWFNYDLSGQKLDWTVPEFTMNDIEKLINNGYKKTFRKWHYKEADGKLFFNMVSENDETDFRI